MQQRMKRFSGILFGLVLVLMLMAGMSMTAYAGDAYGSYLVQNSDTADSLSGKVIKFNGIDWYIIKDQSTGVNAGTVTLLAKDSIGVSKFHDRGNVYSGSTVESYLVGLFTAEEGISFKDAEVAIEPVSLTIYKYNSTTEVSDTISNAKLWLLSTEEAQGLPENVRKCSRVSGSNSDCWWLRSPGDNDQCAAYVNGGETGFGAVFDRGNYVFMEIGVRPALKLNLSSVIFSSESNTFALPVTGVTLNPSTALPVTVGDKVHFTASIEPTGALKKVKWTAGSAVKLYSDANCTTEVGTDATDKLTVYAKGMSAGTATVTVTATNGTDDTADDKSASCNVTVNPVTYEVTYQVVNGTWSDGSKEDKKETVQSGAKPASVPIGMKASSGYTGGAWDTDPASATISGAKTFIFTFTAKKAATVTKAPTARTLTYNGSAQELVNAGTVTDGTMQYILGTDATTAPTDGWSTSVPTAANSGTYYVWYKVVGDSNHNDCDPKCVCVTISAAGSPDNKDPGKKDPDNQDPGKKDPNNGGNNQGGGNRKDKKTEKITISKNPSSVKAKVKKSKVTVSWKKIKKNKSGKKLLNQIKSIQVQYSTDKTFKQNVKTKSVGKTKTKVKLKLQKKTTYFFRVRYKGANGFSKWSKVKKVKTK